ncbi:isochorismatase family cysteine hydrolase [Erythrobacter sp. AP23]|uniref:isochorismatase family cysteine hydrolase n=1 Tax=Erythrobacter sp. AP23 TaxID=499656 RepID=UPI0009FA7A78|nr:cysteine hydrolase family protein [Erythrobacter sp. AP23]
MTLLRSVRSFLFIISLGGFAVSAVAEAPANPPSLDKERTALVFIEFQNEWVAPDGTLRELLVRDEAQFQSAIENGARVLQAAREARWTVAHAPLDLRGDRAYRIFGPVEDALGLRRAIQNAGTWTGDGSNFPVAFTPRTDEFVTVGRSGASVLTNSTLDAFLRNNDINTVVFLGFATHVCVESSLRQAHDLGYNAYVVTDGVGAFEDHQNAYFEEHVLHHFGAGISSDTLIAMMAGTQG